MERTLEHLDLLADIDALYTGYAAMLDEGRIDQWPTFFTDDAHYRITTHENHMLGMPLGYVLCDGVAMIRDRATALGSSVFYRARVQRRLVSGIQVQTPDPVGAVEIEIRASFALLESQVDQSSQLLCCGQYLDTVVRHGDGLRFKRRLCLIDASVMPDSLVFPL